jgi:hypothetical protein
MFGLSTFAQAPFASLGGTRYEVATDESFSLSDIYAISSVDYIGLVDDSIALSDDAPNQFNYFLTNAEAFNVSELNSVVLNTYATINESLALATTETVIANFNPTVAEAVYFMDMACVTGWFVINDSQTPSWFAINDSQTPIWVDVNDAQIPTWGTIPTTVPCS